MVDDAKADRRDAAIALATQLGVPLQVVAALKASTLHPVHNRALTTPSPLQGGAPNVCLRVCRFKPYMLRPNPCERDGARPLFQPDPQERPQTSKTLNP